MKNAKKTTGTRETPAARTHDDGKASHRSSSTSAKSAQPPRAAGETSRSAGEKTREHSKVSKKAASRVTTDHNEIRRWAEERKGKPACVRGTGGEGDIGMIRLDFPGYSGETSLEPIGWDEWFEKFDERNLALVLQEETAGGEKSNFNKIVSRETAEAATRPKVKRAGGR